MFKNILFPTDGSSLSNGVIDKCLAFARESGATVTGLHVMEPFHIFTYQTDMLEDTKAQFEKDSMAQAQKYLAEIEKAADAMRVPCTTLYLTNEHPYEAIIQVAEDKGCDLIVMTSHGRKGVKGFLLGSETQKVLTHSRIPVLVYR